MQYVEAEAQVDVPRAGRGDGSNNQGRRFCFTLNNPVPGDYEFFTGLQLGTIPDLRTLVIGDEVGSEGTPHLQGYLEVRSRMRYRTLRTLLPPLERAALFVARGSAQQNRDYCTKEAPAIVCFGVFAGNGGRTDLLEVQASIDGGLSELEIAKGNFSLWVQYRRFFDAYRTLLLRRNRELRRELRVYVYWGVPGTGKTRRVYDAEPDLWIHPGGAWFDGYQGQEAVLFDDYRRDLFPDYFLLRLLDIYPMDVPIKGGYVVWRPIRIYITSNQPPDAWVLEEERAPLRRRVHEIIHFVVP